MSVTYALTDICTWGNNWIGFKLYANDLRYHEVLDVCSDFGICLRGCYFGVMSGMSLLDICKVIMYYNIHTFLCICLYSLLGWVGETNFIAGHPSLWNALQVVHLLYLLYIYLYIY